MASTTRVVLSPGARLAGGVPEAVASAGPSTSGPASACQLARASRSVTREVRVRSSRSRSVRGAEEALVTSTSARSVPPGVREVGLSETRSMVTGASSSGTGGADGLSAGAACAAGSAVAGPLTSTDEAMASAANSAASTGRTAGWDDGMGTL